MTEATDAYCPRCKDFEPALYEHVVIEKVYPDMQSTRFEGYAMSCRTCGTEITKVGNVMRRAKIAAS